MNEKKLLIQLLKKNIVELNTLDGLSNVDITKFISKYEGEEIIKYNHGIIKLTKKGKISLMRQRKRFFLSKSDKNWAKIPEEMQTKTIEINRQTDV